MGEVLSGIKVRDCKGGSRVLGKGGNKKFLCIVTCDTYEKINQNIYFFK